MNVSHGTRGTTPGRCSRCRQARPRPGQRYCRGCHAEAQKAYRERVAQRRRDEAWELHRLRTGLKVAS